MPGKCFVIMSFKPEYDQIYQTAIRKAVEDCGLECIRLDDDPVPNNIPAEIVKQIIYSDLVIADVTEPNANVYYELGLSHAVGNKTAIISQDLSNLPFDIRNEYTLKYDTGRAGSKLLYFELKGLIEHILKHPGSPNNICQIAGQEYFDLRKRVEDSLANIVSEHQRLRDLQRRETQRWVDNSSVVAHLSHKIVGLTRNAGAPRFVSICGAAGLGKTSLARQIQAKMLEDHPHLRVDVLPLDAYMLSRSDRIMECISGYDPRANNIDEAARSVRKLMGRGTVSYREYDHTSGKHSEVEQTIGPSDIVLIDGIHSFHPVLLPHTSLRIFLYSTPPDVKELRFLIDTEERRYTVREAFRHAEEEHKNYEDHVLHYAKFADIVVRIDSYWHYTVEGSDADEVHADAPSA